MIPTLWFLVVLLAAPGDQWTLDPSNLPRLTEGYQDCMNEGVALMIDKRNDSVKLHCVEAWDLDDLQTILLDNFDFGQKKGQAI